MFYILCFFLLTLSAMAQPGWDDGDDVDDEYQEPPSGSIDQTVIALLLTGTAVGYFYTTRKASKR